MHTLFYWFRKQIVDYNLFIPDEDDYDDATDEPVDSLVIVRCQKYATWVYVVLLVVSLYVLFTIAFFSLQGRTVNISSITPSIFAQLYENHAETLSCPCSTVSIPYSTFAVNNVSLHPVCSSIFVTRPWIEAFYLVEASLYMVADFRKTAFSQVKECERCECIATLSL
jgi:hypothetical protein